MADPLIYQNASGHLHYQNPSGHLMYDITDVNITFVGSLTVVIFGTPGTFNGGTYLAPWTGSLSLWSYNSFPNGIVCYWNATDGAWQVTISRSFGSYGYGGSIWQSANRLGSYSYVRSDGITPPAESDDVTAVSVANV